MRFSPRGGSGSIENGNRLGERPVVRQSKIYREHEGGNAMKSLLGQDHLAWDPNKQQGVFDGLAVYDYASRTYTSDSSPKHATFAPDVDGPTRGSPKSVTSSPHQLAADINEPEYPLPGSNASCDLCGDVVRRFYHCADCKEDEGGLFDLCVPCCGAVYLQQGPPELLQRVRSLSHPTHDVGKHKMVHVTPSTAE